MKRAYLLIPIGFLLLYAAIVIPAYYIEHNLSWLPF